jgi:hypothetical protein
MSSDNTGRKQQIGKPFAPGESGNPKAAPRAHATSSARISFRRLYADWQTHGKAVIETVRQGRPHEYLKLIASIVPKQVEIQGSAFDGVEDGELAALVGWARTQLAITLMQSLEGENADQEAGEPEAELATTH